MDMEALRTFVVLSNTRNFTRAAGQLFVAQSTVTNRINELEKELQVTLFQRTNRSVELTVEGEQFLIYAEQMIQMSASALAQISSIKKYDHTYRLGSADSIYEGHLAPLMLRHKKAFPGDAIRITIGLSANLLEQVQANILDVVFTYLPLHKSDYHCEIFHQDRMVLVTDYANTQYSDGITREELLQVNYLMCNFALQDVGQFIRNLFPKYHQFSLEIDDCSKIVPFLLGQDSYTFLPEDMAEPLIREKKLRSVPLLDCRPPIINSYMVGKKERVQHFQKEFILGTDFLP